MLRDLRGGFRQLCKYPGFALLAIFTLALGIGAATAIAGVLGATLLRPFPYPGAGRLVMVWDQLTRLGLMRFATSIELYASGPRWTKGRDESRPGRLKPAPRCWPSDFCHCIVRASIG